MAGLCNTTITTRQVAATTSVALLVPDAPTRRYLAFLNTGTADVTITSDPAGTHGVGIVLAKAPGANQQGGSWVFENAVPVNALYVVGAGASTVTVVEG